MIGQLPIFITKKLSYLSKKMQAEYASGDFESARRTEKIYLAVLNGYDRITGVTVRTSSGDFVTVRRYAE